ncbi:MAG: IclR family transcriptional regulator, partial [Paucimonas sp.]|nr:IclR family transcriptional regulator [Paucimonas sp.]
VNTGAGAIEKACRILKAMTDPRNARLSDIATYCGMEKSTAMRVLDALMREDMVTRDPASKHYAFGAEIARIGACVQDRIDWRAIGRESLIRLAIEFEDTVILSVLSRVETVCVDFQVGSYPIQANFQQMGSRRTLGVGSGGIVLLAAMTDSERQAALAQVQTRLANYPLITPELLDERIRAAQRDGYAMLIDAVVPHMGGAAAAVTDRQGRPVAALSIAALSERVTAREKQLAAALKREAGVIAARLASDDLPR